MQYVYHFDLAAVFIILTLLGLFFTQRNYPSTCGKIFLGMLCMGFVSSVMDVVTVFTISRAQDVPLWLNYLLNMVFLMSLNFTGVLYFLYVMQKTTHNNPSEMDTYLLKYVCISNVVLIATTPITRLIFSFDKTGTYIHGPLFYLLYFNIFVIFLRISVLFFKAGSNLGKQQGIILRLFSLLPFPMLLFQLFFPQVLTINFCSTLLFTCIYITLENPDDYIDQDSGCYNAIAFQSAIEHRTRRNEPFSIVFFQLDDYAYINQNMGSEAARNFLQKVSEFFIRNVGMQRFFRLTENIFCIQIIPEKKLTEDAAVEIILRYFEQSFQIQHTKMRLKIFNGILRYPDFAITYQDFYDSIVFSLQDQKRSSAKRPIVVQEEVLIEPRRQNDILLAIKSAIKQKSFQVFYQPIRNTVTNSFPTSEALVRLYDNSLGYISPEEFIPMAEKNGLINDIGEQVFREVCRFLKEDGAKELGVTNIHVNLSTIQCMQENLAENLLEIMKEYDISPKDISFEITETASLINEETLLHNMNKIVQAGSGFSMDDYGTGFSTADYLVHMPLNMVKIDKSILWSAMKDEAARTILIHTVNMLQELNKKIVVEGVENDEMADFLISMGCDYLQGYLYSKPISGRDYIKFLKAKTTR
ncbi:MAG: EAL domain-containing protein [Acetatifactor sp.]|nr:EAL domain-containing protein [Acetatifactor sp.]